MKHVYWFEALMGFQELPYQETKQHLEVVGKTLRSRINGRSYSIQESIEGCDRVTSPRVTRSGTFFVSGSIGTSR